MNKIYQKLHLSIPKHNRNLLHMRYYFKHFLVLLNNNELKKVRFSILLVNNLEIINKIENFNILNIFIMKFILKFYYKSCF